MSANTKDNTKDNTIDRRISVGNGSIVEVELDDPNLPDVKVTIDGFYFREKSLRRLSEEFTKLADDLVGFEENAGQRGREDLENLTTSRYGASMDVKFNSDGVALSLRHGSQRFHPSDIQELIDHLKKVQKVLEKSQ